MKANDTVVDVGYALCVVFMVLGHLNCFVFIFFMFFCNRFRVYGVEE